MNRNPRLAITVILVFSLGQGCSSLTVSSSAIAFTAKKAEPQVQETDARAPRSPREEEEAYYQFLLGSQAENQGDLGAALRHYEKTLALDPDSLTVRIAIANLHMERGAFREAINFAEEILSIDPGNIEVHLLLAAVYENIRNSRMAERYYQEVLRLQPDRADVYLRLGSLYTKMTKYPEAMEAYRKAMAIAPNLYQLGNCLVLLFGFQKDPGQVIPGLVGVWGDGHRLPKRLHGLRIFCHPRVQIPQPKISIRPIRLET